MLLVANRSQVPLLCELCARRLPQPGRAVGIPIPPTCNASEIRTRVSPFPATLTDARACKPIACRSSRNTGVDTLPAKTFSCVFGRSVLNSFRIRTYVKSASNPFTIRTSKTQDLKPFRIRTYEKTGGGPIKCSLSSVSETDSQHPSVTLIGVPFWERARGNGGVTRVKTLGR
jgi:hypothetical protein